MIVTILLGDTPSFPKQIIAFGKDTVCDLVHKFAKSRPTKWPRQSSGTVKTIEYPWQPRVVAKTIMCRLEEDDDDQGPSVSIPRQGPPLFQLWLDERHESLRLVHQDTEFQCDVSELDGVAPDPLWNSAEGICRHMEDDHKDTFGLFLQSVGVELKEGENVGMPWVERSGFFLSLRGQETCRHVWIRFEQACQTPNDVRKTLIKMLKEIRS